MYIKEHAMSDLRGENINVFTLNFLFTCYEGNNFTIIFYKLP